MRDAATPRGLGRQFATLWVASAASNLGDGVVLVAAPLLAAGISRDPVHVAGVTLAQRLPWLLFPLLSGALADRLDRRQAMAAVALWRAALLGGLGLALLLGHGSLPLLYAVFFLLSTGETLFDTAAAALLPAVVSRDRLPDANARLAGAAMVANNFAGPPVGGALFSVTAAAPFLAGALGIGAAGALLLAPRGSFRGVREGGSRLRGLHADIAEGIVWLWRHRLLRTLAMMLALLNLTVVAQVSVMVLVARERLGLDATGFGLLLAAHAAGAILGSVAARPVVARLGYTRVLRFGLVVEAATPAAIALASGPVVAGAALAVFGFHALVWGAVLTSLRQQLIPDRLRGRVESVYRLLDYGSGAPGALLGGLLAAVAGLTAPFWLGAAVAVALMPFVWPAMAVRSPESRVQSPSAAPPPA
jgi:MFS family permease